MTTARKKTSLSLLVTLWTGVSMGLGMAVYGVFQYAAHPGMRLVDLFLEHIAHVVVLALPTYLLLCVVLHQVVVKPLNQAFLHLYKVGSGRLEPLALQTNVEEVQGIIDGINIMIWQMRKAREDAAAGEDEAPEASPPGEAV